MSSTSSAIEWLGALELRRDDFTIPPDKLLAGAVDVCAQSYPMGAATRAKLVWTDAGTVREQAMTIAGEGAGPYGHNTLWCGSLDLAAVPTTLAVIAEDAAGAPVRSELAITPRSEITLFDAAPDAALWRMAGPGSFAIVELDGSAALRAQPAPSELGLYWAAIPTPPDFELTADVRLDRFDDNSGVFVRFRDPDRFGYDNPAWVGVHDGLEIQIDETARPDGADIHRTGAVYEQPSTFVRAPDGVPGTWRAFAITVRGNRIVVRIDGQQVTDCTFVGDLSRPERALPSRPGAPRFVGLQSHTGAVAFRHLRLRAL